jgi:hypothetical protein
MAYMDDDSSSQQGSPLVPWILVVVVAVLGACASYNFYLGRESAQNQLKTAKATGDEFRQKAATAEGARLAAEQQLADAQRQIKALQTDKDNLTNRTTDLTNQLTIAQNGLAPAAKGKKGKAATVKASRKRHH